MNTKTKNSQCSAESIAERIQTDVGMWRRPQPPEARRSGGRAPSVWWFLQFLMKITRF